VSESRRILSAVRIIPQIVVRSRNRILLENEGMLTGFTAQDKRPSRMLERMRGERDAVS
jgi:hypothetical protein